MNSTEPPRHWVRCSAAVMLTQASPVHILLDADGVQDAGLADVLREGELYQDAMDVGVSVVGRNNLQGANNGTSRTFLFFEIIYYSLL